MRAQWLGLDVSLFRTKDAETVIYKTLNAEICLAMLINEITEQYPDAAHSTRIPLSFGKLAFRAFDKAFAASILADVEEVQRRLAYLDELAAQGYNIYLLSNNNEVQLFGHRPGNESPG